MKFRTGVYTTGVLVALIVIVVQAASIGTSTSFMSKVVQYLDLNNRADVLVGPAAGAPSLLLLYGVVFVGIVVSAVLEWLISGKSLDRKSAVRLVVLFVLANVFYLQIFDLASCHGDSKNMFGGQCFLAFTFGFTFDDLIEKMFRLWKKVRNRG